MPPRPQGVRAFEREVPLCQTAVSWIPVSGPHIVTPDVVRPNSGRPVGDDPRGYLMEGDDLAELQRVHAQPGGEPPRDKVLFRLRVDCGPRAPALILTRTKEWRPCSATRTGSRGRRAKSGKPSCHHWFVKACAAEKSPAEAQAWLARWRSLSADERANDDVSEPWALTEWLHWFEPGPDARQWRWWNGHIGPDGSLFIDIVADSRPTAHGALDWILRAAGATSVDEAP
jgi:hypothetical protein